jgi:hypothetical protein
MKVVAFFGISLVALFSFSQSQTADSLKGFVVDELRKPIAGATVNLGLLETSTDSSGFFVLDGIVPVRAAMNIPGKEKISLQGNTLKIELDADQDAGMTLFDLRGRIAMTMNFGRLKAGTHQINLPSGPKDGLLPSVYIAKLRYGVNVLIFRWVPGFGTHAQRCPLIPPAKGLTKIKTANLPPDTLIISKTGYATRTVFIMKYSGRLDTITLYGSRAVYVSVPVLPDAPRVSVLMRPKVNPGPPAGQSVLISTLSDDTSGRKSGVVRAFRNVGSKVEIVYSDTSSKQCGIIITALDTAQDTLFLDLRQVYIYGSFAPGTMGSISADLRVGGISDTILFKLPWDKENNGKYHGMVLAPVRSKVNVLLTDRNDSNRCMGSRLAALDSTQDSIMINCTSSFPVVKIRSDTLVGWGDTLLLHGTAIDSVDNIVSNVWKVNGKESIALRFLVDTFVVIPMFIDSAYPCALSVTDSNGNTTEAHFSAQMTCSVRNFRLANGEASSWVQAGDFSVYGRGTLLKTLGSDTAHLNDIAEAAIQTMTQIDQRHVRAVIKDLGTSAKARSLFEAKKSAIPLTMQTTFPQHPDSLAVIDNSPSDGIIVYARYKSFLVELTFTGFLYYATTLANAQNFIAVYEKRAMETSICRNQ